MKPPLYKRTLFWLVLSSPLWLACFSGADPEEELPGSTGGGSGGGSAGGSGGGTGTAVTVSPTSSTTSIPSTQSCSGSTYGTAGDLTAINTPVYITGTNVSSLILRYDLGYYFGEPTRKATISWEGTGSLSSVQWLAEVQDTSGRQYTNSSGQRVFASFNLGTIKGPGEGFGTDSTGSPNWSQTFVTYSASGGVADGVSTTDAQNIYKACFKLANVRVLKLNGTTALK